MLCTSSIHDSAGKSTTTTKYIGFLHYHNRHPLNTVERAIRNAIGLHQLPPIVTVRNVHEFKHDVLLLLINNSIQGRDKLLEIYKYIMYDLSAFIYYPANSTSNVLQLPNIEEIITQVTN